MSNAAAPTTAEITAARAMGRAAYAAGAMRWPGASRELDSLIGRPLPIGNPRSVPLMTA